MLAGIEYKLWGGGHRGETVISTATTRLRYDYQTNQSSMIGLMNEKRSYAGATMFNGKIIGGLHGEKHLNSAEVCDPEVNQWPLIEEKCCLDAETLPALPTYSCLCLKRIKWHLSHV
jgi:hypothetical protein